MYKHLSVRVPWHDNGWDGSVCKDPANNASCLFLSRINEKKNNRRKGDEYIFAQGRIHPL